jgi:hypothetical protein
MVKINGRINKLLNEGSSLEVPKCPLLLSKELGTVAVLKTDF